MLIFNVQLKPGWREFWLKPAFDVSVRALNPSNLAIDPYIISNPFKIVADPIQMGIRCAAQRNEFWFGQGVRPANNNCSTGPIRGFNRRLHCLYSFDAWNAIFWKNGEVGFFGAVVGATGYFECLCNGGQL